MKTFKTIGLALTMFLGILTVHSQTTQTDTNKIKEAKTNLIKYLNLSGAMLSKSTGYEIKYDANEGNPVDLKYTSEQRLSYFAKASEYYLEVTSYYNIISASLTQEEKDEFQRIDNAFSKIIKDAVTYKKIISKPILDLFEEIFPIITFIEITKAEVEDFEKGMLK